VTTLFVEHPTLRGEVTLYPDSGATTYTEGTVKFVQPGEVQLRAALAGLRQALNEVDDKRKKGV
jgi:hypothetical protein